ncbi:hypothetical protein TNCV_4266241 [Trichonephila clavipes]|nr:hypothetical protein TNCV_4266241 [Trichonephila clavipes]
MSPKSCHGLQLFRIQKFEVPAFPYDDIGNLLFIPSYRSEMVFCFESSLSTISDVIKGCGSLVVKVSDHGRHVMSSSPVPLKTHRVGQRCTLNLSRAETSSNRCDVVVRREGASSGVFHVT